MPNAMRAAASGKRNTIPLGGKTLQGSIFATTMPTRPRC
jgi:hypothetical protein